MSDIKITGITCYNIPRGLFIKVETDAGVTGWGESSPNSREAVAALIDHRIAAHVIGRDPFDNELIWDQMFWQSHDLGPSGALTYACAGIDLALWDIKGKVLDVPVYKILGGAYRREIPAYCGIRVRGGTVPVPEVVDRAKKVADLGFGTVKLRMQIREYNLDPDPDFTLKYYDAVRAALPAEVDLFIDPNEGYTASRAISIGKQLQERGMKYFESPTPRENNQDLAEVVRAIDIPVWSGEKCYTRWEFRDLILQGNPDVINPDIIKAGGITEVKKIATLAQTFFKKVVPHNTKPTLGTAAALHLMASISNAGPLLEFVELDEYQPVLSCVQERIRFEDGKMILPEGPGLGLSVIEERVRELKRT